LDLRTINGNAWISVTVCYRNWFMFFGYKWHPCKARLDSEMQQL